MRLKKDFYLRPDVVQIARELIGKYIFTRFDGELSGGIITETEAYEGVSDRASHAYGGRRTNRTEVMYAEGGVAYVYLCYGIHSLFNIVTNKKDVPHAILIRGIVPTEGVSVMLRRTGREKLGNGAGIGPGKVSKLLGIHYSHTGINLNDDQIWLEDGGLQLAHRILTGPRIGINYAGPDALLPYRFWVSEADIEIKKPATD